MPFIKVNLSHAELCSFDHIMSLTEEEWQAEEFEFDIEIDKGFICGVSYKGFIEYDLEESCEFINLVKSKWRQNESERDSG